jgi:protein-arginine kinase activator protein McsA
MEGENMKCVSCGEEEATTTISNPNEILEGDSLTWEVCAFCAKEIQETLKMVMREHFKNALEELRRKEP